MIICSKTKEPKQNLYAVVTLNNWDFHLLLIFNKFFKLFFFSILNIKFLRHRDRIDASRFMKERFISDAKHFSWSLQIHAKFIFKMINCSFWNEYFLVILNIDFGTTFVLRPRNEHDIYKANFRKIKYQMISREKINHTICQLYPKFRPKQMFSQIVVLEMFKQINCNSLFLSVFLKRKTF